MCYTLWHSYDSVILLKIGNYFHAILIKVRGKSARSVFSTHYPYKTTPTNFCLKGKTFSFAVGTILRLAGCQTLYSLECHVWFTRRCWPVVATTNHRFKNCRGKKSPFRLRFTACFCKTILWIFAEQNV